MRIIREGQLPEDKLYRGTCHNCKTEFECKRHEGIRHFPGDQRDGEFVEVFCPKCGKQAFAYPIKGGGGTPIPDYSRDRYTWRDGDTTGIYAPGTK